MIENLIPEQGFEKIRDRIGCIIVKEYHHQFTKFKNSWCDEVKVFAERVVPIDKAETAVINISTWKGDYGNKNIGYVEGEYGYIIEIITNAKAKGDMPGDTLAGYRLQKHIGMVRYILEHSIYGTMEFDKPFVIHTEVNKFQVEKFDNDQSDSVNNAHAQVLFKVRCGETTDPVAGTLLTSSETNVKLETTELGYQYVM